MRFVGLVVAVVVLAFPASAAAETFSVTGTTDGGDCEGTVCPSIRAALWAAQGTRETDTIVVPAGTYRLTRGALTVTTPVTIRGASARLTTIVGDSKRPDRVFFVAAGVTATFTRLTMTGGTAGPHNQFSGGNLRNDGGTVLLDHVRVTGGAASSGGGVANVAGTMRIQHSLIDRNRAPIRWGSAGGIQNYGSRSVAGILTVRDSTVAFNTATVVGGIHSWGNAQNVTMLERVTVAYNVGGFDAGGIAPASPGEAFRVRGSIIAHNTFDGAASNCGIRWPDPISDGGNVVSGDDCGFAAAGDLQNADPLLSLDTVNAGGETDVLTIDAASPARNRAGDCLGADQRDLPRPQVAGCDSGAFEVPSPDTFVSMTPGSRGGAPTFQFASLAPGVRFECRLDRPSGAGAFLPCTSPTSYPGLPPGAYTFSVRAVDSGGAADPTPASTGFTVQLPPPEPGKSVNALPKSGTVKYKVPGSNRFVELEHGEQVPLGTVVDARKGRLTLVAASNRSGGTVRSDFYAGRFKIGQTKGSKLITTLKLNEKLSCPKRGKASTAARRKKRRRLWGAGSGTFRTEGSHSSATVRGTKWLVEDRCGSTLTRVVRGKVAVRDFAKDKTVIVRKGKRYIARAR